MHKFALLAGSLAALAAASFVVPVATAPAAAQGVSITVGGPRFAPPPTRYERRGARPNRNAIWINGHWNWNGRSYVWVSGRWNTARAGRTWINGHWEHRGRTWVWIDGRWR